VPPSSQAGATATVTLAVPIGDDKGNTWRELTLVEPELQHRAKVQRAKTATQTEHVIGLIALLSGVPEVAIRRMKARDAHRIKAWLDGVLMAGVRADVLAEVAAAGEPMSLEAALAVMEVTLLDVPPGAEEIAARARKRIEASDEVARRAALASPFVPPLDPTRTFDLYGPVETNDGKVARVTLREPDLESAVAVERMNETSAQATAAMIASLSGLTIPVVMRMKQRDVVRMERWLDFFSDAGSPPPTPVRATTASGADGATSR
jgi:hypothetical protein